MKVGLRSRNRLRAPLIQLVKAQRSSFHVAAVNSISNGNNINHTNKKWLQPTLPSGCLLLSALTSPITSSLVSTSSRLLSSVSTETAAFKQPRNWNEDFRPLITRIIRNIIEDTQLIDAADQLGVQRVLWQRYVNNFRRNLIKDSVAVVKDPERHQQLLLLLQNALTESTSISNNSNNISKHSDSDNNSNGNSSNTGNAASATALVQCTDYLSALIFESMESDFSQLISEHRVLSNMSDMRLPHEWFPRTRLMRRKIIFHGGPTNSGKTYHALQRLREADPLKGGGLYCGPLRLLALEVYEQLNQQGAHTSLLTGQEKREIPGSSHISCTLEMVNVNRDYDVAVIDEIQMIADKQRGYAWTRALLGLRAREIHVCGGLEASAVVRSLAETAGDEFELKRYNRLSTLQINEESLKGDYSKVQPGDCIVAFSKADIFSIRRQIEQSTPHRCAIIYGQLPSETRSTQARLFNDENSGYDVLVASDAIGMGLNLNIRRIIFHTTLKRHRDAGVYWVEPSAVKQIAGRAGRLSSKYAVGEVTAWQEADLAYVKAVMQWEIPDITAAGIFPTVEQIELFSKQLEATAISTVADVEPSDSTHSSNSNSSNSIEDNDLEGGIHEIPAVAAVSESTQDLPDLTTVKSQQELPQQQESVPETSKRMSEILQRFVRLSRVDQRFFMCDHDDMIIVSNWLQTIPLSLADRFVFSNAPVNMGSIVGMNMLYSFAASYALGRPVALNVRLPKQLPGDLEAFTDLCTKHNILELYLWLSLRFPKHFIEHEQCSEQKLFAVQQIEKTLHFAARLKHGSKHATSYFTLRRLLESRSEGTLPLPPAEFGASIRESALLLLQQIPREELVVLPAADAAALAEAEASRAAPRKQQQQRRQRSLQ